LETQFARLAEPQALNMTRLKLKGAKHRHAPVKEAVHDDARRGEGSNNRAPTGGPASAIAEFVDLDVGMGRPREGGSTKRTRFRV
jgi:hypothetical protein